MLCALCAYYESRGLVCGELLWFEEEETAVCGAGEGEGGYGRYTRWGTAAAEGHLSFTVVFGVSLIIVGVACTHSH